MREEVQQARQGVGVSYNQFLAVSSFVIFLFHGVVPARRHIVRNYINKHIVVDRFVAILRGLLEQGNPISLSDVVAAGRGERELPERSFIITFDDGFANNFTVAAPILNDLKVPAAFFITTSFVDENKASWIDRVEQAVESVTSFQVELPDYGLAGRFATDAQKIELLNQIRQAIFGRTDIDPYDFAEKFASHIGAKQFEADKDLDWKLNWPQVKSLSGNDLFSIGGHSHTHPVLEHLKDEELAGEIGKSMVMLKDNAGVEVKYYSYPQGLSWCYSDRVIKVLKRYGIVCCPTAEAGINRVGDDLFRLKRIMVT